MAQRSAGEVRLLGGRWKRTPLTVPVAAGLRPTPARVRETLFNWLGQDLAGWRVLDAYAGSGALGLEAASRGAQEVCLIERNPLLSRALVAMVDKLGAREQVRVLAGDALNGMRLPGAQAHFDLVFLDPPFDEADFPGVLAAAVNCVPEEGWIYLESPHSYAQWPEVPVPSVLKQSLVLQRHGQAGAVHFHLFRRVAASAPLTQADGSP